MENGEIVLYQPNEVINLEVRVERESVWLSQAQMAQLYGTQRQAITKHVKNIYDSGELERAATSSILELVQKEGGRAVRRSVEFYNLDVIISVGYRVNTKQGIIFRKWANQVSKEYLLRGYSVNKQLVAIQERADERFQLIEKRLDSQQEKVDFLVKAHTFPQEDLFATGCVWDAYTYVCDLVRSAKNRIVLVDNFVDDRVLKILDKRLNGVVATIHTRYTEQFELDIKKHNEQYPSIEHIQLPKHIHDRFLIVDDDVYLLGASVKDMGKGLCAITKVGFYPDQVLSLLK